MNWCWNQNPARARSLTGRPENRHDFLALVRLSFSKVTLPSFPLDYVPRAPYYITCHAKSGYFIPPQHARKWICVTCIHHPADNSPGVANTTRSDLASQSMLPQPPNSAASALLHFPVKIRNNIYKEVLVVAHPIYLFQDPGCPVETFAPDRPRRWLALLHVNRQVRSEASVIVYGMNNFTLLRTPREPAGLLQAFLDCIGPSNASLLSHICINFPALEAQPEREGGGGGGGGGSGWSSSLERIVCRI